MARALKKRGRMDFGIGETDERRLRAVKVKVMRDLHAREPLPEEPTQ